MQTIQIQTAQNVFIEYQPAGVGDRILAYLIDYIIKVAYGVIIIMLFTYAATGLRSQQTGSDAVAVVVLIILLLPLMFYSLVLEIIMNGQTIGKRAMNIKVVKLDGTQPSVGAYLLRWLCRIIDVGFLSGVVAIIVIATSTKGQRLGDMAAGTTVITLKRRVTLAQTRLPETPSDYEPVYPEVARLGDRDAEIIRETLQTYQRNGNDPQLAASLAGKLKTLLNITSDQPNKNVKFQSRQRSVVGRQ